MTGIPAKKQVAKKTHGSTASVDGRHKEARRGSTSAAAPSKDEAKPLASKSPNVVAQRQQGQTEPAAVVKKHATRRSGTKTTNVTASQQEGQRQQRQPEAGEGNAKARAQATASVVSRATSHKPAAGRYVTIRARAKLRHHPLQKKIKDMVRIEKKRDAAFANFIKRRNGLHTSFMPNSPGENIEDVPSANPDYMNFLNMEAFGNYERMYTKVAFGENPASAPVDLVIDTGSAMTWVNKTTYEKALADTNARAGSKFEDTCFEMAYAGGTVQGDLLQDRIKLCGVTSHEAALTFAFGVVDERTCPDAERWRTDQDVEGILGLGNREMAKGTVKKKVEGKWKKMTLPPIMDRLLEKGLISSNVIGIHYELPDEGKRQPDDTASQSSGSDAGIMDAVIHLGGYSTSIYKAETLRWIPATTVGASAKFCGVDIELKYGSKVVMAESPGIIDTGGDMIGLPSEVLDAWLAAANEGGEVVKFDRDTETYHMKKADFGKLKPLEFDFKKGSNAIFKLEPRQQVFPPSLKRKEVAEDRNGDHLYFVFRRLSDTAGGARKFNLGQLWIMWYYIILDPSDPNNKQVGIAEISGHTSHKWRGL